MRRRILPMAMEQTNRAPKKEAIWYQNSLTSTTSCLWSGGGAAWVEIIMACR